LAGVVAGFEVPLLLEEVLQPTVPAQTNATTRSNAISFFTVRPSFQLFRAVPSNPHDNKGLLVWAAPQAPLSVH
jgi:hypothetical protein